MLSKTGLITILIIWFNALYAQNSYPIINPQNIKIARDEWGTPHIFAPRDPEVAYGLAWANAEDAFETIQEALLSGKGLMGKYKGKEGAAIDFFVHSIGAERIYEELKDSLSSDYLAYVDGYCQGINAFARKFPERVLLSDVFPVQIKDIIKIYIVSFAALSGSPKEVEHIMNGKSDALPSPFPVGSNAYAFNSAKTIDGKTYLAINPHFMIEGPLSFYDAHLCSEEGLNIVGTLFQGGTCVFMGNNEHLGWGHTYNYLDQVDIFELQMKKGSKNQYLFDGQYLKLEKRPARLRVRLGKKLVLGVRKMTWWSVYGPCFRSPKKRFFALRSPSYWAIRSGEQFYRMNKARNFDEFKDALRIDGLPMFNIVYADREGNILYLCNGIIPKRPVEFDYSGLLPGNDSKNLWTEFYPLEEKPQVANPACGYVFNMNNTPSNASCPEDNFNNKEVLRYTDLRSGENNRSTRFMEMVDGEPAMGWEEFKNIKFDRRLSPNTRLFESLRSLQQIRPESYPHISEPMRLMQNWDGDANLDNTTATLVLVAMQYIFQKKGYGDNVFILGVDISEAEYVVGIEYAARYLNKNYNSLRVPLRQVTCHERNGRLYCAAGFPDMLSPGYSSPTTGGKMKMEYGDTYIHFVRFNSTGPELIETLLPFENSPTCEEYRDELEMFNRQELKTMSLDKAEVLSHAKKIYAPE